MPSIYVSPIVNPQLLTVFIGQDCPTIADTLKRLKAEYSHAGAGYSDGILDESVDFYLKRLNLTLPNFGLVADAIQRIEVPPLYELQFSVAQEFLLKLRGAQLMAHYSEDEDWSIPVLVNAVVRYALHD